jgi:signal transduction histidine kinase
MGRHVLVPIYRSKQFLGFLVTVLDESEVIDSVLAGHVGLGYGIAVLEDHDEIYRTPGSNPENEKSWAQEVELRVSGASWQVRVWPEAEVLRRMHSKLPMLLPVMGTVIALLLFVSVDLARSVYSKTRGLRLARSELELRVEERTEQLSSKNEELKQEISDRQLAEKSLQDLSGRLLSLRDEEQRRIARELHDSTVQTLGAVAIDLEKAQQVELNHDGLKVQMLVARSSGLVEQAISELRTLSYLLHPPILDDLGLEGVLPWYTAGFGSRSGIAVKLNVQALGRLSTEIELTVFRILQEGLANIHRHSGSSTAEVTVSRESDRLTLQIVDQGSGIHPSVLKNVRNAGIVVGVGTAGMRERVRQIGGSLEIVSDKYGTSILATIPINTAATSQRQ